MTYKLIRDIKFGTLKNQDADLLVPNEGKRPLVVLVHGGAWITSKKEDFHYFAETLVGFGYAVLNVNYRLVPDGGTAVDMLDDIDSALRLSISNADEWGIDVSRVAFAGCSAGAHLAMLYVYKGLSPVEVPLVFNMVGPTDLTDSAYFTQINQSQTQEMLGVVACLTGANIKDISPQSLPKELAAASPLFYINSKTPKTISAYGRVDNIVPLSNGLSLDKKLREEAGYDKSDFYVYENSGHSLDKDPEKHVAVLKRLKEELTRLLPF